MTIPLARTVRKLKQAISRRLPKRRADSGLTTLEWLLIVAAVAGLAALAVVLVQNVVSETGEQIAGSSARKTAAQVAGIQITNNARLAVPDTTAGKTAAGYNAAVREFEDDCNRIKIVFSDVDPMTVTWTYATQSATGALADTVWDGLFDNPAAEGCVVT